MGEEARQNVRRLNFWLVETEQEDQICSCKLAADEYRVFALATYLANVISESPERVYCIQLPLMNLGWEI